MSHAAPLADGIRRRLVALVRRIGERETVSAIGVSRQTLGRALGGLGLYPSTHFAIEARLDALDAKDGDAS